MSTEIIPGVHATRAEMLMLRKRAQLARRGHDLLVEKRDALLLHFFEAVRNIGAIREKLVKTLDEAYKEFMKAQLVVGLGKLSEVSHSFPDRFDVTERTRNIIGVPIPFFELHVKERPEKSWWYSLYETSATVDRAVKTMEDTLRLMVELAEVETAVKRLAEVIIMTRRRVNALENIIIPRLENTVKFIQMHLEERAREDFFRLKRIKALHEARRVAAPPT